MGVCASSLLGGDLFVPDPIAICHAGGFPVTNLTIHPPIVDRRQVVLSHWMPRAGRFQVGSFKRKGGLAEPSVFIGRLDSDGCNKL